MKPDNAAALVGAGLLSVLLFPLLAMQLRPAQAEPAHEHGALAPAPIPQGGLATGEGIP